MNIGSVAVAPALEESPSIDKRDDNRIKDRSEPPKKPPEKNKAQSPRINVDAAMEIQRICAEMCGGER